MLICISFSVFFACQKESGSNNHISNHFEYLDSLHTIPLNNPITLKKIALGEKLFFDPLLSKNQDLSCASCHNQKLAFSDGIALSSIGNSKSRLDRNSPALFNLAWHSHFFWDGGKTSLENQAFGPLRNEHEMAMNLDTLISRLNKKGTYQHLFKEAFTEGLNIENVVKAIASYERTLISFSSKYDKYKSEKKTFLPRELQGEKVFLSNCSSCHTPPLFTDTKFHNTGLDSIFPQQFSNANQGRYRITGKIQDQGKYKTPSMRNLAFTSPYMHDGRFSSLTEVLNHYESPHKSNTLDTLLFNGIHLTTKEKKDLIIFLNTLNDTSFINKT